METIKLLGVSKTSKSRIFIKRIDIPPFCFKFKIQEKWDFVAEYIIENDTIYLKTFPLEKLEMSKPPFGNTKATKFSTASWRGYRAI